MSILTAFIAFIGILLMIAVLIQNPKGGGVDSTFGGAQANQMFGAAKSSDFIEKATWILAAAMLVLCLVAAVLVGDGAAATEQILTQ